jgi:hypothetical protein
VKGHEETSNVQVQWLSIKRVMSQVTEKDIGERETRYNDDDLMMNVWIRKIRNDTKC